MDWSNECVLEFVELLEGEPCIWNPKNQMHKNRNLVSDAWVRIKNMFSLPCSVEDLKRKRNTLLTQYRECLKKIKDSTKTGAGSDDIYKPSWFAFDAIDRYMGGVYYRQALSTETRDSTDERFLLSAATEESNESPISDTTNIERTMSQESYSRNESSYSISKRQRGVTDLLMAKKQMDEAFNIIKNASNRQESERFNECDLYGQLLSEKMKSLHEDDRLGLMNAIDNLVFKYILNIRKRNSSSTHLPSVQPSVASHSQSTLNDGLPSETSTPLQMDYYLSPDSVVGNHTLNNVSFGSDTSGPLHKKQKVTDEIKIKEEP